MQQINDGELSIEPYDVVIPFKAGKNATGKSGKKFFSKEV
jgi:hypothetical protein